MPVPSILAWGRAFALTLVVELPVAWLVLRKYARLGPLLGSAALASAITHPVFWWVALRRTLDYPSFVAWGEILITLFEAGVLAVLLHLGLKRALLASVAMNAASFLVGIACRAMGRL
jgi:hypothetical protein